MFVFSKYQQVVYEAKLSDSRHLGGGELTWLGGRGDTAQCKKIVSVQGFCGWSGWGVMSPLVIRCETTISTLDIL